MIIIIISFDMSEGNAVFPTVSIYLVHSEGIPLFQMNNNY